MQFDANHLNSHSNIPRDRVTINAWCRSTMATDPMVNAIIEGHSSRIANAMTLDPPEGATAVRLFEDQIARLDLQNKIREMVQEYWVLGETFVYTELDEKKTQWRKIIVQNPDHIVIKRAMTSDSPTIMMRPDENLRRLVFSASPDDQHEVEKLDPKLVGYIKTGENIPLDDFYATAFIRKSSPYEIRGTSLMLPFLAANVWISQDGTPAPRQQSTESDRASLMDPSIKTEANLTRIRFAYETLCRSIEQWANNKLFAPVAKMNDFYTYVGGEKILTHSKLRFDTSAIMTAISQ